MDNLTWYSSMRLEFNLYLLHSTSLVCYLGLLKFKRYYFVCLAYHLQTHGRNRDHEFALKINEASKMQWFSKDISNSIMCGDEFNNNILADHTFKDEREVYTIRTKMSKVDICKSLVFRLYGYTRHNWLLLDRLSNEIASKINELAQSGLTINWATRPVSFKESWEGQRPKLKVNAMIDHKWVLFVV